MIGNKNGWLVVENAFDADKLNHHETIFTIGNGYLGTRGAFEEYYPNENRSTFLHGVFDDTPVVFTELANAPDWMELEIWLAGERFSLEEGSLEAYHRELDMSTATIKRSLTWRSPNGRTTRLEFERFASLADLHLCALRVQITPLDYTGKIYVRTGLNGEADNLGLKHWQWLDQGARGDSAWLKLRTRGSGVELGQAVRLMVRHPSQSTRTVNWDLRNHPGLAVSTAAEAGETVSVLKWITQFTSRDTQKPLQAARKALAQTGALSWEAAWEAHRAAWEQEWQRGDVVIEGDDEAQLAIRFNIFQLLIAAPRTDERVNLGAKTLSGYGYRGHAFWDTEIFMLPFFTYNRPEIARNLLSYRWHNLPGARQKAAENQFKGAQYPWESAATGEEVTPTWVANPQDRTHLIRIWTGDIEIHISADIAYAIWQYWQNSGDDEFLIKRGAEVILETARFWASRVEWEAELDRYEISDIIGPDEYHDHVDNNIYTNAMVRWNLQTAFKLLEWLSAQAPADLERLKRKLKLRGAELETWKQVIEKIYLPFDAQTGLVEQFEGYFQREDVNLAALEPRSDSMQSILGIEGVNRTQILKQPDVLMLMYLLPELYSEEVMRTNYAYYTARTDHTFGSSLGPSIMAIMAARANDPSAAYEHFMRAARADLFNVRNNAGDGIHGASAGGLWQAVVFGFGGLRQGAEGWEAQPNLPPHWKRLAFRIVERGQVREFDLKN